MWTRLLAALLLRRAAIGTSRRISKGDPGVMHTRARALLHAFAIVTSAMQPAITDGSGGGHPSRRIAERLLQ